MMTKFFLKVSWMLGLIASSTGCTYSYNNEVEWRDSGDGTEQTLKDPTDEEFPSDTTPDSDTDSDESDSESSDSDTSDTDEDSPCETGFEERGGACVFSLAQGRRHPTSVALDDTYVYWTEWGTRDERSNYLENGGVYRVSKTGGEVETLADNQYMPTGIQLDDTSIYWSNSNNDSTATNNEIMRVAKQGGTVETLASDLPEIGGIALGIDRVLFAVHPNPDEVGSTIFSVPKTFANSDGGTNPAPTVFFEEEGHVGQSATSPDRRTLYWNAVNADWMSGTLKKMPLDKSEEPSVIAQTGNTGEIAVDDVAVYCIVFPLASETMLQKFAFADAPDAGTTLAFSDWSEGTVALWGDKVYWTMDTTGRLMESPSNPGDSTVLVTDQPYPMDIAVDAQAIFWINDGPMTEDSLTLSYGEVLMMRRE